MTSDLRLNSDGDLSLPAASVATADRVLVAAGDAPIGWFERAPGAIDEHSLWRCAVIAGSASPTDDLRLRAWAISRDLLARSGHRWPARAPFLSVVSTVGPGNSVVWVTSGRNQGTEIGDIFWARTAGGQPTARFDVRFVDSVRAFCAVTPLVTQPPLKTGMQIERWPAPGSSGEVAPRSAVVFVEQRDGKPWAWVAAPVGASTSAADSAVEFRRDGRFVGHGVVERLDARFWYVRLLPAGMADAGGAAWADSAPAHDNGGPADSAAAPSAAGVRVGDDAMLRIARQDSERGLSAHVFELAPDGAVVLAGELDGLEVGQRGHVRRSGSQVGTVVVRRLQRTFSTVALENPAPGVEMRLGDEVQFGPQPEPLRPVGRIERVFNGGIFVATWQPGARIEPPVMLPLRDADRVAAAIVLEAGGGRALGYVVEESLQGPLVAGMELLEPARE